jgi:hypothetical protein
MGSEPQPSESSRISVGVVKSAEQPFGTKGSNSTSENLSPCQVLVPGSCAASGTPAKKRTIPHFPFPPLILEGFPATKNLGSFREPSGRNLTYQKIVDFGSW